MSTTVLSNRRSFLQGQITELALELAFETDKPSEIADEAHWLDILFKNLRNVETKASKIIGRGAFNSKNSHQFRDGRRQKKSSYPAKTTLFCSDTWQRGQPAFEVQPQLLRSRDNHRGVRWLSFLGIFKPHI